MICFFLVLTLLAGEQVCHGFDTAKELFPCKPQTVKFNVSLGYSDSIVVVANHSYCDSPFQHISGFRFLTRLESENNGSGDASNTIIFSARRGNRDGLMSWRVPLQLQLNSTTAVESFSSVSHTFCPVTLDHESQPHIADRVSPFSPLPLFYVDVFTYSSKILFYSITVEPVKTFTISPINSSESGSVVTTISPSAPQVFYYKFPSDYEAVVVEVLNISTAVGCAFISVQNNTCPFNDLLDDSLSKGMYQSMTEKAVLTVETKWVRNREFLIILVAANYSICHDQEPKESDMTEFLTHGQKVEIKVKKLNMIGSYTLAIMFPILLSLAIVVFSSVTMFSCCTIRCETCCVPVTCKRWNFCYHIGPCKCICMRGLSTEGVNTDSNACNHFGPCVAVCCRREDEVTGNDDELCIPCGEDMREGSSSPIPDGRGRIQDAERDGENDAGTGGEQNETTSLLRRSVFAQDQGGTVSPANKRKYHLEYAWSAIVVGIFYALPTTQLLIFHQRILHWSGNQDACYYNFMCTRPAFQLDAFNNVWSNLCYVLLGLWFCVIVLVRHCSYYWRYRKSNSDKKLYMNTHGIHQHFGIYYAMGLGLALEGLMGCLYHVCPNNANFQFDTAFMYIIGGLIIVKLLYMRHPSVSTNVFAVFISLGVVIFFVVIGIYNDRHSPFAVKLTFGLLMLFIALPIVVVSFFALKLYKTNIKRSEYSMIGKKICCKWYTLRLLVILMLNFIVCILFLTVVYNGIASTILTMIVMNALLLLLIYSITKLLHGEPLTFLTMVLPVIIGASCIFAFCFYGTVTEWAKPPAESRAMNSECVLLEFYDKHDVWHMSFACAMFFIYLFILVIDDGVGDRETKKLKIF